MKNNVDPTMKPYDTTAWENIQKTKWKNLPKNNSFNPILKQAINDALYFENTKLKILKKIHERIEFSLNNNNEIQPVDNIMDIVSDMDMLTTAYGLIYKNKGSQTPGSQGSAADNFGRQQLENLSIKLKTGSFEWSPVKRVYIPKPGKKELRPLGLPDFYNKVVQGTIRLILECVFEPHFNHINSNYGFRPNKDCCLAVEKIQKQAQGTSFAIEGDIKGAYDSVDHKILMNILSKHIIDKKFLKLIKDGLKAGIMEDSKFVDTFLGIPQGGIASPILFNIYMHEFDLYIHTKFKTHLEEKTKPKQSMIINYASDYEKYRNNFRRKTNKLKKINTLEDMLPLDIEKHIQNSKYCKNIMQDHPKINQYLKEIESLKYLDYETSRGPLGNKRSALKKYILKNLSSSQKTIIVQEYCAELKNEAAMSNSKRRSLPSKNLSMKTFYIRYADDWILFIDGTNTEAEIARNLCKDFLLEKLKLTLSLEKTKITNFKKETVKFLGFEIYYPKNPLLKKVISKDTFQRFHTIQVHPDRERLDNRFKQKNYVIGGKPREVGFLTPLEDHQIITKFNQFMMGISNYYIRVISYPSRLNKYMYWLYVSCLKTLAAKHKTKITKIVKEYGYTDLSVLNPKENDKLTNKRIISTFTINGQEKHAILLNWKELMFYVSKTRENHKLLMENNYYSTIPTIDFLTLNKINFRTAFKTTTICAVCGAQAEHMHHIKKLNHISGRYQGYKGFDKVIASLNRKQIPVCKICHQNIHNGKYDGTSLQDLYDFRIVVPEGFLKKSPNQNQIQKTNLKKEILENSSFEQEYGTTKNVKVDTIKKTYLNFGLRKFLEKKTYAYDT